MLRSLLTSLSSFFFRQLAHSQLVWYKKEPGFRWLNMAPQGQRLPLATVADAVARWFTDGTPLPTEWEGEALKELVSQLFCIYLIIRCKHVSLCTHTHDSMQSAEEQLTLKEYSGKHSKPLVFSDKAKIDSVIQQIEACLHRTLRVQS